MNPAAGMTLVELLVVLVLFGILLPLGTVAIPRRQALVVTMASRVAAARLNAARSGTPIHLTDDSGRAVLVLPDGSVLGTGFDPLNGGPDATR
jgi:prepilin-type N-terminal cleavage/methylation domain-containing protein